MAERAVQYADATPILVEARLVLARALHAQGKLAEAQKEYQACASLDRSLLTPILGVAQILVAQSESQHFVHYVAMEFLTWDPFLVLLFNSKRI